MIQRFPFASNFQFTRIQEDNPLAQLDDVHSILRLSYETLKGLTSLASRGVAKLTVCETNASYWFDACPARPLISDAASEKAGTNRLPAFV
jgi:hypothetical protein